MSDYYEQKIGDLKDQIKELTEQNLRIVRREFTQICSYCGWESKGEGWEELQAHLKVCNKHPLPRALNALTVAKQALLEIRHAQDSGAGWYTKGESGLFQQVRMWINKATAAIDKATDEA